LVRSRQTAEILHSYQLSTLVESSPHLAFNGDIYTWVNDWLLPKHQAVKKTLALVGHQPNLGEWAEILVWGETKQVLVLKKAGIIGLKLPDTGSPIGRSQMFWLTPPKFFLWQRINNNVKIATATLVAMSGNLSEQIFLNNEWCSHGGMWIQARSRKYCRRPIKY